jgi:hypothetical protein
VPGYGVKAVARTVWPPAAPTIGVLAAEAGVGGETIRVYQRRGLLSEPARGRVACPLIDALQPRAARSRRAATPAAAARAGSPRSAARRNVGARVSASRTRPGGTRLESPASTSEPTHRRRLVRWRDPVSAGRRRQGSWRQTLRASLGPLPENQSPHPLEINPLGRS